MNNDPTDTFRQEAAELLEQLELGLLDLGQTPDDTDLVNFVFRALHTIKGSGSMFGFTEVADFVHNFETAFDRVRKGLAPVTDELVTIALAAKDHINGLINDPDNVGDAGERLLADLATVVTGGTVAVTQPEPVAQPVVETQVPSVTTDLPRWRIRFYLPADALLHGTNPVLLIGEITALGQAEVTVLTDRVPSLEEMDPEQCYFGWQIDLAHEDPRPALDDVFLFLLDGMELSCEKLGEQAIVAAEPAAPELEVAETRVAAEAAPAAVQRGAADDKSEAKSSGAAAASSLRVPAERLDELMDRVGELVIAQARLTQLAALSADSSLKSVAEELERLSSGLRDTTMGIRMVPIGSLFSRFRRLVHDLSTDLGKEIEFITSGEETELDKTMIERLADPLVHLIRNSVDHGLESADRRVATGKAARGTVRLSAVYAGAEVTISVSDDGAGLNTARIRQKAEENGLITADTRLTDSELHQLIFAPGFSTAKEVTALSGRGVGMDVVKKTIESLRGKIHLTSEPGKGTTITLRLPLTLAIIEGMLVRVGQGRYAIPLSAVEECVELPETALTASRGRNFLDIRGSLVPFISLRDVFETPGERDPFQKVVIVSSAGGRVGLVVDQIIGNTQTVIKQLSKLHADLPNFSGATILGDGTVALILDTARLVDAGQVSETQGKAA